MPPKYRAGIKRSAKKKKPPGRKGEKEVNDSDSVVDFSTTGSYTELFCYLDDASKVCRQNIKSSVVTKKRRKTLRSIAKGYIDKETEEEPSYSSGAFSV